MYLLHNYNSFCKFSQILEIYIFYTGYPHVKKDVAIGRVYTVSPRDHECFFLRILLLNVKGPTSFIDLKTVEGIIYETFEEACKARGLLLNDEQWENTLNEAVTISSPTKLRELFTLIIVYCCPMNSRELWNKFKDALTYDIYYRFARSNVY